MLTLFAGDLTLRDDPDKTWGVATLALLGPAGIGLVGLMLACLMAALMSSVDCYMLVCSALVVRNIYVPLVNPAASERQCVNLGRITGGIVVLGAVVLALTINDVFKILQFSWIVPMTFAAPFWIGMYWRRATTTAAWGTVFACVFLFFVLPRAMPVVVPGLRENPAYARTNQTVRTESTRLAAPSDVARRQSEITNWEETARQHGAEAAQQRLGDKPQSIAVGDRLPRVTTSGGKAIFWEGGIESDNEPQLEQVTQTRVGEKTVTTLISKFSAARGAGSFRVDLAFFDMLGLPLETCTNASLATLDLPLKILAPFVIMAGLSLVTRRNGATALDRFYVKLKTPVEPDPALDARQMQASYADPRRFDHRKLFRHPDLEIQRPTRMDFVGFIVSVAVCFGIIGLVLMIASIGS